MSKRKKKRINKRIAWVVLFDSLITNHTYVAAVFSNRKRAEKHIELNKGSKNKKYWMYAPYINGFDYL